MFAHIKPNSAKTNKLSKDVKQSRMTLNASEVTSQCVTTTMHQLSHLRLLMSAPINTNSLVKELLLSHALQLQLPEPVLVIASGTNAVATSVNSKEEAHAQPKMLLIASNPTDNSTQDIAVRMRLPKSSVSQLLKLDQSKTERLFLDASSLTLRRDAPMRTDANG